MLDSDWSKSLKWRELSFLVIAPAKLITLLARSKVFHHDNEVVFFDVGFCIKYVRSFD